MYTQSIFKAGNSQVVAIPKAIADKIGLTPGQKVVITHNPDQSIVIRKADSPAPKDLSQQAFDQWYTSFINDNADILDELAKA